MALGPSGERWRYAAGALALLLLVLLANAARRAGGRHPGSGPESWSRAAPERVSGGGLVFPKAEPPAEEFPPQADEGPITFAGLRALLDLDEPKAVAEFKRALNGGDAGSRGQNSSPELHAQTPEAFRELLERASKAGPMERRNLAAALGGDPKAAERLRAAILAGAASAAAGRMLVAASASPFPAAGAGAGQGDDARAKVARPSSAPRTPAGQRAAPAGRSSFGAGLSSGGGLPGSGGSAGGGRPEAEAHSVSPKLKAPGSAGPGADSIAFIQSMLASLPEADKRTLIDACWRSEEDCDPLRLCLQNNLYPQCLAACAANPECTLPPPPGGGPAPTPGPTETDKCSDLNNRQGQGARITPPANGPQTGMIRVVSNSSKAYFVVGPHQVWGWNGNKDFPGHVPGVYSVNTDGGYGFPTVGGSNMRAAISPLSGTLQPGGTLTFTVTFCEPN